MVDDVDLDFLNESIQSLSTEIAQSIELIVF